MAIWEIEKYDRYDRNELHEETKERIPAVSIASICSTPIIRRSSNANLPKPQKEPRKYYKLNLKSCQSSSNSNGHEIVAIDSNPDLGMFVAINKLFIATVHSLKTGACLNWIKFSSDYRSIQGIQLSKNGYFVLACCVKIPRQNPVTQMLESHRCTSFQTFGINGECITPEPFYTNSPIQAAIMNERLYSTISFSQSSEDISSASQIDDKMFFFERSKANHSSKKGKWGSINCVNFE